MKYFVFADPHGHYTELKVALDKAGYDETNDNHKLIGLGDYFDRGEENDKMAEFIIDQYKKDKIILVLGNHDEMLLNVLTFRDSGVLNCIYNGLHQTINDLSDLTWHFLRYNQQEVVDSINKNYPDLLEVLRSMVDIIEIGDFVFTHAGYTNTFKQPYFTDKWEINRWGRTDEFVRYFATADIFRFGKKYVFGHWHAFDLRQKFLGEGKDYEPDAFVHTHYIGLDACTTISKKVNVMVIDDNMWTVV